MNLTLSQQHYLRAVYAVALEGSGARVSDIATELNVTKPSACVAMSKLQKYGLIYRDKNRLIFLTKDGKHQASLVLDKVSVIREYLTDVLGVKYEIADTDACAIEHAISKETLCSLCQYTNRKCMESCHIKPETR